ncbi:response regulator [Methanospirillum stamsii]|uniref:Response regulatory domain-containing protein n=1 Tax=Methanospirillum stamsii TaxID=1277351 RepID=A0A2V2N5X0_9EURY|nr:response regulator [Methanospirillum stamsii]PWR75484.1 hypothetical protein DLD82_04980 [Methanospirillum stamsii]
MKEHEKVLVVEDEFVTGLEIRARLEDLGYDVPDILDNGEDAVKKVGELHPDIMIMDITLKGEMTGIEAADIIRKKYYIPVIYLTAHSDEATVQKAIHSEPFGYLIKPLEERALHTTIRMALYKHAMDKALVESEKRYRAIAELSENIIFILNPDYSVAYLNSFGKDYFHVPDMTAAPDMHAIFPPDLLTTLEEQAKTVFEFGGSLRVTHSFTYQEEEVWLDSTIVPVMADDGGEGVNGVIQVVGQINDISSMVRIEKEIRNKGIEQIEQNMEQFLILNDQIRNPLAIIASLASMSESKENNDILDQVKRIDNLVNQLDKGWIQSDAVRNFLLKHYKMGKKD